jgi:hypothetical protein
MLGQHHHAFNSLEMSSGSETPNMFSHFLNYQFLPGRSYFHILPLIGEVCKRMKKFILRKILYSLKVTKSGELKKT